VPDPAQSGVPTPPPQSAMGWLVPTLAITALLAGVGALVYYGWKSKKQPDEDGDALPSVRKPPKLEPITFTPRKLRRGVSRREPRGYDLNVRRADLVRD